MKLKVAFFSLGAFLLGIIFCCLYSIYIQPIGYQLVAQKTKSSGKLELYHGPADDASTYNRLVKDVIKFSYDPPWEGQEKEGVEFAAARKVAMEYYAKNEVETDKFIKECYMSEEALAEDKDGWLFNEYKTTTFRLDLGIALYDLDDDGDLDILAYYSRHNYCGASGGCPFDILRNDGEDGYTQIYGGGNIVPFYDNDIIALSTKTNGMYDIWYPAARKMIIARFNNARQGYSNNFYEKPFDRIVLPQFYEYYREDTTIYSPELRARLIKQAVKLDFLKDYKEIKERAWKYYISDYLKYDIVPKIENFTLFLENSGVFLFDIDDDGVEDAIIYYRPQAGNGILFIERSWAEGSYFTYSIINPLHPFRDDVDFYILSSKTGSCFDIWLPQYSGTSGVFRSVDGRYLNIKYQN